MLCDVIIPVWNQLILTKDCVKSVLSHTNIDYRLIIIDNASDEDTKKYLEGLRQIKTQEILLIRNGENAGFLKAVNQGIRSSDAFFVCLLNNDTLVTEGWLKIMIDIANSDNRIGVVNPSSNNLGQRPAKGEPIELYAEKLKKEAADFIELGAAIGFCMLIKREVIDRIGLFDEIYGMGNFEDTDYSRRAIKEGYKCVRACGAYVYHRENASFNRLKTFDEDFKRNKEIYEFRWGKPRRVAYILDSQDEYLLKKIEADSIKLAREGNWVWYFFKEHLDVPAHSNIIAVGLPSKNFYFSTMFRILKKKKRFDEIFVGGERLGKFLEATAFIHKARINYY